MSTIQFDNEKPNAATPSTEGRYQMTTFLPSADQRRYLRELRLVLVVDRMLATARFSGYTTNMHLPPGVSNEDVEEAAALEPGTFARWTAEPGFGGWLIEELERHLVSGARIRE